MRNNVQLALCGFSGKSVSCGRSRACQSLDRAVHRPSVVDACPDVLLTRLKFTSPEPASQPPILNFHLTTNHRVTRAHIQRHTRKPRDSGCADDQPAREASSAPNPDQPQFTKSSISTVQSLSLSSCNGRQCSSTREDFNLTVAVGLWCLSWI